jgi:hypothetical protein
MIGLGHEKDGLYYLDLDGSYSLVASILSATISPLQWYFRLGHPSWAKLKSAIPTLRQVSSLEYEACQLGKHHRSSFPRSSHSRHSESFDESIQGINATPKYESCAAQLYLKAVEKKTTLIQSPSPKLES